MDYNRTCAIVPPKDAFRDGHFNQTVPIRNRPANRPPRMNRQTYDSAVPFSADRVNAAAVYCSDGRFGAQCDDLLLNALRLPRYDRLAVPGGAACLAGHFSAQREEEGVAEQLLFLIREHALQQVVLFSHEDCAFYTKKLNVSPLQLKSRQLEDVEKAVRRVRRMSSSIEVLAYFARRLDDTVVRFDQIAVS